MGGGANYYVSFDNVKVGALQGEGLIKCLDDKGLTKANIVYINGAATDNNATLFKQGYEEALAPKIDSGDYTLVGDQSGEWDSGEGPVGHGRLLDQAEGRHPGRHRGQRRHGRWRLRCACQAGPGEEDPDDRPGRDGRGSQPRAHRPQCGTVFKDADLEADAAAKIAIALANGDTAGSRRDRDVTVTDTQLYVEVPFVAATPVWISDADVQERHRRWLHHGGQGLHRREPPRCARRMTS